jgi:hypothetical protein
MNDTDTETEDRPDYGGPRWWERQWMAMDIHMGGRTVPAGKAVVVGGLIVGAMLASGCHCQCPGSLTFNC